MPATRSGTRTHPTRRLRDEPNSRSEDEEKNELQRCLSTFTRGITKLEKEITTLRKENETLKSELDDLRQAGLQPKRGKQGHQFQKQILKLSRDVERLQAARKGYKRRIRRLEAKEIQAEAIALHSGGGEDTVDLPDKFRELLREIEDLVSTNSYEEKETCPVCFEDLTADKCQSLTCDHIFCNDCLENMASGKSSIICPTCRQECDLENLQNVPFSAKEQWDKLLDVVKAFAGLDSRRDDPVTADEEAEEQMAANFIDDDSSSDQGSTGPLPDEQVEPGPSYFTSPTAVKRKKLEELVELRKR